MPDQPSLFVEMDVLPDPKVAKLRQAMIAELTDTAERHQAELVRILRVREKLQAAITGGSDQKVVVTGLRLPKPWRLRSGSNMDVIAMMLENAGRKGVSEDEMVDHLRAMGRLLGAQQARKSVHWTIYELRRRTLHTVRKPGGRWYAYGPFHSWRGSNT